jgi:hypothetical protein
MKIQGKQLYVSMQCTCIDINMAELRESGESFKRGGNSTDETVLVSNNPTLLKTLWRPLDVCSSLVYFGDGMLSP